MKKKDLIIYRIVTGLFTVHTLFSAGAYIFMYDMTRDMFESLGVPEAIIYPFAIAKLLGIIAIWSNKSRLLTKLAYAGFAMDFLGASAAHLLAGQGIEMAIAPLVVLAIAAVSFIYNRKIYDNV